MKRTSTKAKSTNGKVPSNGILGKAVPVSEVTSDYIKINIYGQNRTGKTTLAATFPKPLILISFEPADAGGAESVTDVEGVKFLQNKVHFFGKDDFISIVNELKTDSYYQTVVLDSITSMSDWYLAEALGLDSIPEQQEFGSVHKSYYQKRSEVMKESLRPLLGLEKHVVILAKERDHRPPDRDEGDMKFTPKFLREAGLDSFYASDVGASIAGWIQDACPYIARLFLAPEVKTWEEEVMEGKTVTREEATGRTIHRLRVLYHPNFATGLRTLKSRNIPEYIDEPDFDKIVEVFKG